ncbi:MAG: hypothetical protein EXR99_10995 [Gemmataceae bacterium]|nr:hypothetical protein [Gemmataceae bacterium]
MRKTLSLALIALMITALVGCGGGEPAIYPVKGTVKYSQGKAVTGGIIEFTSQAPESKGKNSSGNIQPDGSFELETPGRGKGAYAGDALVILVNPPSEFDPTKGDVKKQSVFIPNRYSSYQSSSLKAKVEPKENSISLVIDPK